MTKTDGDIQQAFRSKKINLSRQLQFPKQSTGAMQLLITNDIFHKSRAKFLLFDENIKDLK